jgi:putative redox protein
MIPIVVTRQGGLRFAAQVGFHELIMDQPVSGGGEDAGPSPLELFGAALGGCVALYVHKFLETRHLTDATMRVEVTQTTARNPYRIGSFEVRILLGDEVPAVYHPMIEAAARVCPAYNTLARTAEVDIAISAAAPTPAA